MKLAAVSSGVVDKPMRVLVYGVEKIGKSTFAAGAPGAVFLGAEDGTAQLDVCRFPQPESWTDALEAVHELHTGEHAFKTLVIDTIDWLEPMLWAFICKRDNKRDIESYGYSKGQNSVAIEEWRILLSRLDRLRAARGMHVVLLGHSWIKPFKNPDGDDYDRYELKVHHKAGGLIKEWCDAVLFAQHETFAVEKNGRIKGVSNGARVVHTQRRAAWDAGNRYGLPETLPLSWADFEAAARAGAPANPQRLREEITGLLALVDEPTRQTVTQWLTGQRDARELAIAADRLRAKANSNDNTSNDAGSKEETNR